MGHAASPPSSSRRARRSFWVLLGVAVLASGSLSAALAAPPGPLAGVRVAVSGVVLVVALALVARLLAAFDRARRRSTPGQRTRARRHHG